MVSLPSTCQMCFLKVLLTVAAFEFFKVHDFFHVHDGATKVHAFVGLSGLKSVLEVNSQM